MKYLTPPQLARIWCVKSDKVLQLIRRGELRAFNAALNPHGKARWKIPPEAVVEFEQRRAATPPAKRTRRRQRDDAVLDIIR